MIRRIAAHFYLNVSGEFEKYPIISISNGVITDISIFEVLPEIAGLEFYSGVLLPLFVDVISPKSLDELLSNSSFRSSLISKVVLVDLSILAELLHLTLVQREKIHIANEVEYLSLTLINDENLSLFKIIDKLVDSNIFPSQIAGINYFTNGVTNILNIDSYSRICVGATAEFILCSDLNLVKSGHVDEAKFRQLI